MIKQIVSNMNGILSVLLLAGNTAFWFPFLISGALIKLAFPMEAFRKLLTKLLNQIAMAWITVNNINIMLTKRIRWIVEGIENLERKGWYIVISNHRSWADIVVLQKIFNRKIPFLKFFLKKELMWVPLLGMCWWALDFPFMKRYSAEFLKKHPDMKGKDIEITKKACRKFRKIPVSIMNFVEGTRFTREKHDQQKSPYVNLLNPKAGGIGFVLSAMGGQISDILNVTIAYPEGDGSFWSFLCGRVREIKVIVQKTPITQELLGDYVDDPKFRERFQLWLNAVWMDKDRLIGEMM